MGVHFKTPGSPAEGASPPARVDCRGHEPEAHGLLRKKESQLGENKTKKKLQLEENTASWLLWAPPTPEQSRAEGYVFPPPLGSSCLFPAPPGLPGSSADLSPRAVSNHPGRPDECSHPLLPRRSQASPPSGGLAAFALVTRPNRVRLRYGSRVRPSKASPVGIAPTRARRATC